MFKSKLTQCKLHYTFKICVQSYLKTKIVRVNPGFMYVGLRIYRIKDTRTQRDLNGWFRVEFWASFSTKNPDLHDGLKLLLIHVEDDYNRRQSIGEFSLNFPTATNSCPQNDATKYMILSCGGASRAEPLVILIIVHFIITKCISRPDLMCNENA